MTFEAESYLDPELYDLAYSWYTSDIDFYVDLARHAQGPALEVACGTGRIYLRALATGADIDGLDLNPAMLAVLERKAAAAGLKPRVRLGDMRDFTMPRRYALITIPFRSFMHVTEKADQVRALRCIREHLDPDGRLVFNVFYPNFEAIIGSNPEVHSDRDVEDPRSGRVWRLHVTSYRADRVNQVARVEREFQELDEAGRVAHPHAHRFSMRWTWLFEMELLLEKAGFSRHHVAGGFDGRPLERDTDEMVWTAWR